MKEKKRNEVNSFMENAKQKYMKILLKELLKEYIFTDYVVFKEPSAESAAEDYRSATIEASKNQAQKIDYLARLTMTDQLAEHPAMIDHPTLIDEISAVIIEAVTMTIDAVVDSGLVKPDLTN